MGQTISLNVFILVIVFYFFIDWDQEIIVQTFNIYKIGETEIYQNDINDSRGNVLNCICENTFSSIEKVVILF